MLLIMKVANVVITYVAGATLHDNLLEFKYNEKKPIYSHEKFNHCLY